MENFILLEVASICYGTLQCLENFQNLILAH